MTEKFPLPMVEAAAAAIANARAGRRGAPAIENVLEVLNGNPRLSRLYTEVMADAAAALLAAEEARWRPMVEAPRDGSAVLAFGIHDHTPPDAQRGVVAGDRWWAIILWDVWRGGGWVFSKDGAPVWSEPLRFMELRLPPGVES